MHGHEFQIHGTFVYIQDAKDYGMSGYFRRGPAGAVEVS
jgi:hypothetical protein